MGFRGMLSLPKITIIIFYFVTLQNLNMCTWFKNQITVLYLLFCNMLLFIK